jgi:hypothetical protein
VVIEFEKKTLKLPIDQIANEKANREKIMLILLFGLIINI